MIEAIGVESLEDLFSGIPSQVRLTEPLSLGPALSEWEAQRHLRALASENRPVSRLLSFLGAGAYEHYIPSAIAQLLARSEYYTAYTPYQAEVSQGTLQTIFEFQTMICELTGMDIANASVYDGASALAEASLMAGAATDRSKILMAETVHPWMRRVLETYRGTQLEAQTLPWAEDGTLDGSSLEEALDDETAAVVVQSPNLFGILEEWAEVAERAHGAGALLIAVANPVTLGILAPPGDGGADIVVGEGQPLGIPLSYGGPYLGFFACREEFKRLLPGRVVGQTVDAEGRRGYVLTLQTREQHIRRERATSNICTNHALCALAATIYLSLVGKAGLVEVGRLCFSKAQYARERLAAIDGVEIAFAGPSFHEFAIRLPRPPEEVVSILLERDILAGVPLASLLPQVEEPIPSSLLVAVTECRTREEIDQFAEEIAHALG